MSKLAKRLTRNTSKTAKPVGLIALSPADNQQKHRNEQSSAVFFGFSVYAEAYLENTTCVRKVTTHDGASALPKLEMEITVTGSSLLIGTKRMLGRMTASQIASASATSFLLVVRYS